MVLESLVGGGLGGAMTAFVVLKGIDDVSGPTGKAESSLKKFMNTATNIGVGLAAVGIGGALALAKIGAESLQTARAFEIMAKDVGISSQKLIADLTELSGRTISQTELMIQANKALIANIPTEAITKFMQIARAAATAVGGSVTEMFERLVSGASRMESEILKSVGIIVRAEDIYGDYAATLGKTASELNTTEKFQAFLNATLAEGEKIIKRVGEAGAAITEAEVFQQLSAAVEDLKSAIGEKLVPVVLPFIEMATNLIQRLGESDEVIKNLILTAGTLGAALVSLKIVMAALNAVMSANPALIIGMAVAFLLANKLIKQFTETLSGVAETTESMAAEVYNLGESIDTMSREQLVNAIDRVKELDIALQENKIHIQEVPEIIASMNTKLSEMGTEAVETAEEITLLDEALGSLISELGSFENAEAKVKKEAKDTLKALIEQEKVEKKKWQTTEEFGDSLRELGVSEEFVAQAMKDGFIQLEGQEALMSALGETYLTYLNALRESVALTNLNADSVNNLAAQMGNLAVQTESAMASITESIQPIVTQPIEILMPEAATLPEAFDLPTQAETFIGGVSPVSPEVLDSFQELNSLLEHRNRLLREEQSIAATTTTLDRALAFRLEQERRSRQGG